jgi:hypothetical protein
LLCNLLRWEQTARDIWDVNAGKLHHHWFIVLVNEKPVDLTNSHGSEAAAYSRNLVVLDSISAIDKVTQVGSGEGDRTVTVKNDNVII